jgi:hypothetical protein
MYCAGIVHTLHPFSKFGRDRLTVAPNERDHDKRLSGSAGRAACAPVAAMLFDPLAPGAPLRMDTALQLVALPGDFAVAEHALVTLGPGPHLADAGQLLPVVRMLAGLVLALGELPGLRAVAWLPARLAMSPAWFAEAIGIWLKGGPFPALALTGLARSELGFASQGLSYFVGQEFIFSGKDGALRESDVRGAVRLTDWLVAHGRVDTRREVELAGFGTVLLEPEGQNSLRARSL